MEHTLALQAIQLHNNAHVITPADVNAMLANVHGTTFATIVQVTKVATAAAHKAVTINKVTEASVHLFNNIKEFTSVYANAVKRDAGVTEFTVQDNYFEHTDCYSVVKHKTKEAYYLYAIYNKATSVYVMDGKELTKAEVAEYMTPSAARALLNPQPTHNVLNDVEHSVAVRTVALANIVSIVANKQLLIA
jgi:phenylpyruvate tautomerase PptA (4-oxalocrotonate tautomerase family)